VHSSGEDEDQFGAARCIRGCKPCVQAGHVPPASVGGVHGTITITHSEANSVRGVSSDREFAGLGQTCPNGQLD
jgi:hypothetical protein